MIRIVHRYTTTQRSAHRSLTVEPSKCRREVDAQAYVAPGAGALVHGLGARDSLNTACPRLPVAAPRCRRSVDGREALKPSAASGAIPPPNGPTNNRQLSEPCARRQPRVGASGRTASDVFSCCATRCKVASRASYVHTGGSVRLLTRTAPHICVLQSSVRTNES
jgi:hypothetical protein